MRVLAVALLAAVVTVAGVRWGTFAVGGSDSHCYAHQAERWASGRLQVPEPLALEAPWPDAPLTFAPAGHIPSPTVPGAIVPMCPAGLSLAMAPLLALGGPVAIFFAVPLFGGLLAAAVYCVGSRYSTRVGFASAVTAACSPAFLFQLFQPMSDVPAAALWVLATACATSTRKHRPLAAGLAASAAILVRPNLLPLGIVIGVALLLRPERTWRERIAAGATYAAAAAAGCLAVAAIQQTFYGSPLQSGYGSLAALFSFDHIEPNARRYAAWLLQTHTPLWLLALLAPFFVRGWLTTLLLSLVVVNVACYLPYTVFDDWWYLRFLLPAIPLLLVLTFATIDALVARVQHSARLQPSVRSARLQPSLHAVAPAALIAILTVLLAALFITEARHRQTFDLARLESRYVRAGQFVATRLPANALVITSWESGSVRFYSGRRTLVWDALDPAWLDRAIAFARDRGLEPYLLFERWEEPIFRVRFAGSAIGALDWPPSAEIASQVRIYRPDDRLRYRAGANVRTEYAR